ncbi:MAG: DUF2071 domain-containing protein [Bacteroidetes bacterium]|nr:DUF2071 domain-containing protein [Bacteroidota bacterium]
MTFSGELQEVRLINFSVEREELKTQLPAGLKLLDYNGRAMISMVDVKLRNMKAASFLPSFSYRHIGFRLLLDDQHSNGISPKGIYFLKSFSDKLLLIFAGNIVADFNLSFAKIHDEGNRVKIAQGDKFVEYSISDENFATPDVPLFEAVKRIDRAYAFKSEGALVTKITREEWPIEQVELLEFKTNFFKSAKMEGAFKIRKVIDYVWEKPFKVKL